MSLMLHLLGIVNGHGLSEAVVLATILVVKQLVRPFKWLTSVTGLPDFFCLSFSPTRAKQCEQSHYHSWWKKKSWFISVSTQTINTAKHKEYVDLEQARKPAELFEKKQHSIL
jgi:hypothetical protein